MSVVEIGAEVTDIVEEKSDVMEVDCEVSVVGSGGWTVSFTIVEVDLNVE